MSLHKGHPLSYSSRVLVEEYDNMKTRTMTQLASNSDYTTCIGEGFSSGNIVFVTLGFVIGYDWTYK